MSAQNTRLRYGTVAMSLHWLIALLVIGNIIGGITFSDFMSRDNPLFFPIIQIHKSIGLTVLVLSILRLVWRVMNPVPALPPMSDAMRLLARGTHWLFYFLIIAIPLAGWLMISASSASIPTTWFGLFQVPTLSALSDLPRPDRREWHETFETAHAIFAYGAAALLVLHVGAALYHQFSRRDDVLKRMWFGTKVQDTA
ncbi:MAG TPA: cytochrome b [Rhizomicrobium sp.]|jgi:cytochrome b561|nr:cytochrome b [Rhizomicrobium sp.]